MPSECSDLCPSLKKVCKPKPPQVLCPPPEISNMWHRDRGYICDYADESVLKYSCLLNYHYVSGSLVRRCQPNGTWSGRELLCHVDFFKQRYILSFMIISLTFVLFFMFLSVDIFLFISKRERNKEEKARHDVIPTELIRDRYTVNRSCVSFYKTGSSINPKVSNRPRRCMYPGVKLDWNKLKEQALGSPLGLTSNVDKFDFLFPQYEPEMEGIGSDKPNPHHHHPRISSTYQQGSTFDFYLKGTRKKRYTSVRVPPHINLKHKVAPVPRKRSKPRPFGLLFANFNERRLRERQEAEEEERRMRRGGGGRPLFLFEDYSVTHPE